MRTSEILSDQLKEATDGFRQNGYIEIEQTIWRALFGFLPGRNPNTPAYMSVRSNMDAKIPGDWRIICGMHRGKVRIFAKMVPDLSRAPTKNHHQNS